MLRLYRKKTAYWPQLLLYAAFFICSYTCIGQHAPNFSLPSGITPDDYAQDVIIIKIGSTAIGSNARSTTSGTMNQVQKISGSEKIQQVFSESAAGQHEPSRLRLTSVKNSLSEIYKVYLPAGSDMVQTINQLLQIEGIVYAEPYYFMRPLTLYNEQLSGFIPNDPEANPSQGKQNYLAKVQAYEAWQIEKGDSSILIGILDTGVGLGHQDLMGNLYYNKADPMNGVDDDQDGYVDNYLGWDMADHDNDPTADKDPHGTEVTGLASATTDNATGIAGAGFKSSYMPVKIFRSVDNLFWKGYEAIAYAADRGCKVLNLSWGAANAYSAFGQDVINYAVLEKDVVIVAAAGNSGKQEYFYPASYDHVLSVAMSDANDNKVPQTTYNYSVDIMAPGSNNYTTTNGDLYKTNSGSSLSAPLVAGTAALMRARYPALSALQVMEKLRLSADNVYAVGTNANYAEQLGYGRLNMKKALQDLASPAVRMSSFQYQNHIGAYAFSGDTLRIQMNFINYFKSTTANATVTLSALSKYVTVLDSVFHIGTLDSMKTVSNSGDHFLVYLHHDLPANEKLWFRLGFEDEQYADYQHFIINSSPDHILIDNGTLQIEVGGNGNMAYNPNQNMGGRGMLFQNITLAKQMGLMIATGVDSISDNVIKNFKTGSRKQDFKTLQALRLHTSGVGGIEAHSAFSDKAAVHPLGVRVEQTWLWDTVPGNEHFFITEYSAIALEDTLTNLHMGIFTNWNLGNLNQNKADWDDTHSLGYVYNGEQYAGVALLSSQPGTYHAIDLKGENGNTAEVGDTLTEDKRYLFLSGSSQKSQAGVKGAGNDVAFVVGGKASSVLQNQRATLAFALVAGSNLVELQDAVTKAKAKYTAYLEHPALSHTVYVCSNSTAAVAPKEGNMFRFYSDPLGENLLQEDNLFTSWPVAKDTAVFFTCIDQGYESRIKRVDIKILEPVAAFSFNGNTNRGISHDTLFIDDSKNYLVRLTNQSQQAVAWEWDLGNGFKSRLQHPETRYTQTGTYTITLRAFSKPGCADVSVRTLTVVERSPTPDMKDQLICAGSSTVLQAENSSMLKFYADAALKQLLYHGPAFSVGPISVDTVFYVVNTDGAYESITKKVSVGVVEPFLEIVYTLDTMTLQPKYEVNFHAKGLLTDVTALQWYVDDIFQGEGDSIRYDFSVQHDRGIPLTVRLDYTVVSEGLTCVYSTSKVLVPSASAAPGFAVRYICQNDKAVISPLEGNIFYFYKDISLKNLIHKGRQLVVEGAEGSHVYYVTRMDGLKESTAVPVTVNIHQFADFAISTDTLYLSEDNQVTLEGYTFDHSDPNLVSWSWDIGTGQFANKPYSFTHIFDTAGIYTIKLKAHTADGCTNIIEKVLVVQTVAGTETDIMNEALKIYPNPSSGKITIENKHWLYEKITLRLLSMQGEVLYRQVSTYPNAPLSLDLSDVIHLPAQGLYLLQIESRHSMFSRKIIISSIGW